MFVKKEKLLKVYKIVNLTLFLLTSSLVGRSQITNKDELQAYKASYNSFIWAYPIVKLGLEMSQSVNTQKIKMNEFFMYSTFNDDKSIDFQKSNDALGLKMYFDLKNTAIEFLIPSAPIHYFSLDFNDAFSNNFGLFSSLKNPQKVQKIILYGPDYKGDLPKSPKILLVKSPTNIGWVNTRTMATTALEITNAKKLLDGIKTSSFPDKNYTTDWSQRYPYPIFKITQKDINIQIENMDWREYFRFLSSILKENGVPEKQKSYVADFEVIGLIPGDEFEKNKVKKSIERGIKQGFTDAVELLKSESKVQVDYNKNGWSYNVGEGFWANKYTKNAASAYNGFNQSPASEFMKYIASSDSEKELLGTHSKGYSLTFKKLELPSTKSFWTIEIFDKEGKILIEKTGKYGFNNKTKGIKLQKDGSLKIMISEKSIKGFENNWIPQPKGEFRVILKVYNPGEMVTTGEWAPPSISKNL